MNIKSKLHYMTSKDLVEVMSIASWIAILADCIWVIRDSVLTGFTPTMILIMSGLLLALIVLSKSLWHYHSQKRRELAKQLLASKLDICQRKYYNLTKNQK